MAWSTETVIDAIFIPLYAVVLIANLFNCAKHGMKKEGGYLLLVVACGLKITGSVLLILFNTGRSTDVNVDIWGQILIQLGLFPLLAASLVFIQKWIRNWQDQVQRLSSVLRRLRLLNLLVFGALLCSIIGGIDQIPSSDKVNTGYTLRRLGNIFFIVAIIAIFAAALYLWQGSRIKAQRRDLQIRQVFMVLPIVFVRTVYSTIQAFVSTPSNPGHNTWVYLCLLLIPDWIGIVIYTLLGFKLPPSKSTSHVPLENDRSLENDGRTQRLLDPAQPEDVESGVYDNGRMGAGRTAYRPYG